LEVVIFIQKSPDNAIMQCIRKIYKDQLFNTNMLRIKKISEVLGRNAYTDSGEFLGEVEEANLAENKIDGWRIKVSGHMVHLIGGARGIIVPHQFVKAISDIFIINKASLPAREEEEKEEETEIETIEEA
jgi:sporulation protein YlmC with PRC-barrel domain